MISNNNLVSFHILERELDRNLIVWTYPTIADGLSQLLITKCFSIEQTRDVFFCLRRHAHWIYIQQVNLNESKKIAMIIVAEQFNIPLFKSVCDIFTNTYIKNTNPVDLVKLYLSILTKESCSFHENGYATICDLKTFKSEFNIKDLISEFNLEIIIIYTALLFKRRILVYHDDIEILQRRMSEMCSLSLCRNINEYFHPLVENLFTELNGYSFYLAGIVKYSQYEENACDIFVNLPRREIFINQTTKDVFVMTKIQKEIANYLVEATESDVPNKDIEKYLSNKYEEIINHLKSFATVTAANKKMISINDLKNNKLSKPWENFFFNLGIAENLIIF